MTSTPDITPTASDTEVPAPVILDVDDAVAAFEPQKPKDHPLRAQAHELDRQEANDAVYTWEMSLGNGNSRRVQLHPMSLERWTIWHRLERHFAPMAVEEWVVPVEEQINDEAPSTWSDRHVPSAWSMLWLMSHDVDSILDHVAYPKLFWMAVLEWGQVHCTPEKWPEALKLMRLVSRRTRDAMTSPRVTSRRRSPGLGE